MSRPFLRGVFAALSLAFSLVLVCTLQASSKPKPKAKAANTEQSDAASGDAKKTGKPSQVASYGDWGVFVAQSEKTKTCYALATPKERVPSSLSRDPAYVFIANRPGEKVRQEVSIIMGFPVKEDGPIRAEIGNSGFDFIAKGTNAWIKNQAEEPHFVEALKKGAKLIVKAPSLKGHATTDSYSLAGLAQALDRVDKECP